MASIREEIKIQGQEDQRNLLKRMIAANINHVLAMQAIALWLWLELKGFKCIFQKIASHGGKDDTYLVSLVSEVKKVIESTELNTMFFLKSMMPITSSLAPRLLKFEELIVKKEKILKKTDEIYKKWCLVLFQDILAEKLGIKVDVPKDVDSKFINSLTGAASEGSINKRRIEEDSSSSRLNANAPTFHPFCDVPEAERCLFLTFSNGYPFQPQELRDFFQRRFGAIVESVMVDPRPGNPPVFGKIKFDKIHVPQLVLRGRPSVKLKVNGKTLLCKPFEEGKTTTRFEDM